MAFLFLAIANELPGYSLSKICQTNGYPILLALIKFWTDAQESIEKFDFVIERNPGSYLYFCRVLSYLALGNKEKAWEDFQKIRKEYAVKNPWIDCMIYSLAFLQFQGNNFKQQYAFLDSFALAILALKASYPMEERMSQFYDKMWDEPNTDKAASSMLGMVGRNNLL